MLLLVITLLPSAENSLQLASLGDIMLGRGVAQAHAKGDWETPFIVIEPVLSTADLSFANLESPITDVPLIKETYDLRAPSQSIQALASSGITLLSLSNNHIADAGQQGIEDTLSALASEGILSIGPGSDPLHLEVKGISLAWFAFSDIDHTLDLITLKHSLSSVRGRVDFILISMHWGNENQGWPNPRQKALARAVASFGADIVLGHHPHVLQPVEFIWGEGRGRPTLVVYSLGNALFDQGAPPAVRQGSLLLLTLGDLGVKEICAVPFQLDPTTWNVILAGSKVERQVIDNLAVKSCTKD
jgi:poly-gamma-glutamate synthesis protein (capsule biosynthesis protein)